MSLTARLSVCTAMLLLNACATTQTVSIPTSRPAPSAPAAPNVNLTGFPPEFRKGYADGCTSARSSRLRDEARFKNDPQYASGWRDGNDICSRQSATAR